MAVPSIIHSEASVTYTDALNDWNLKTLPLEQYLQQQQAGYGQPTFTRFEVVRHSEWVVPFFDFDLEFNEEPPQSLINEKEDMCNQSLQAIFSHSQDFDFSNQVRMAHRHGWKGPSNTTFKISLRYWVRGFKIQPEHVKTLISACEQEHVWDTSIYSSRRKMGIPGACKGMGDHRVLEVADRWTNMQDYVIGYLAGDEFQLAPADGGRVNKKLRLTDATAPESWEDVEKVLTKAGFINPSYTGTREMSMTFTADNLGVRCPCCPHIHDRQNW